MMLPEQISLFKSTPGAISVHEFFAIRWLAGETPLMGAFLDIGSNAGKAAIAEAAGLAKHADHRNLLCIDTVFDLENEEAWRDNHTQKSARETDWAWIYEADFKEKVKTRIKQAGCGIVSVCLYGESALTAIPRLGEYGVAFAFCDADSNQRWLVDGIVDLLAPLMVTGGIIAHHDFENQFIAPQEAQKRLLETGRFERINIPWEEIKAGADLAGGETDNDSWHARENPRPMFVGAIRRK